MSRVLHFEVLGTPVPQGSMTALRSRSTGQPVVVNKDPRLILWRGQITAAARQAIGLDEQFGGPIGVRMTFWLNRPKMHYGTGRNAGVVKASAPAKPQIAPDLDKLVRAVFDAITDSGLWGDDGQVTTVVASKTYAGGQRVPGVTVSVGEID